MMHHAAMRKDSVPSSEPISDVRQPTCQEDASVRVETQCLYAAKVLAAASRSALPVERTACSACEGQEKPAAHASATAYGQLHLVTVQLRRRVRSSICYQAADEEGKSEDARVEHQPKEIRAASWWLAVAMQAASVLRERQTGSTHSNPEAHYG